MENRMDITFFSHIIQIYNFTIMCIIKSNIIIILIKNFIKLGLKLSNSFLKQSEKLLKKSQKNCKNNGNYHFDEIG